jgi:hypothetical protein
VGELLPDQVLLSFLNRLPGTIRHDLWDAIALAFERRPKDLDESALPAVVRDIIQPGEDWLMRQRVVLVAGLLDHLLMTMPEGVPTEEWVADGSNGESVSTYLPAIAHWHYRRAQELWSDLRAGPLSPEALSHFS